MKQNILFLIFRNLVIIIVTFGALTAFLASLGSIIGDSEPTGCGDITEVYLNQNFFESKNDLINTALVLPRWFYQVGKSYDGLSDSFYFTNQFIGFVSMFILMISIIALIEDYHYDNIIKILIWTYVLYWIIPTFWWIIQWIRGNTLIDPGVWY